MSKKIFSEQHLPKENKQWKQTNKQNMFYFCIFVAGERIKSENNNDNYGLVMHCKVERQICPFRNFKRKLRTYHNKTGKGEPEWALGGTY